MPRYCENETYTKGETLMQQKQKTKLLWLLLLLIFFIVSFSVDSLASQKAAKRKTSIVKKKTVAVIELRNIEQLKEAFQKDIGKIRLVTILSPT